MINYYCCDAARAVYNKNKYENIQVVKLNTSLINL